MTPQDNTFNGGIWATLEGYVRNWAKGSDTLYVVTGCVTEGAKYYSLDRSGKKITVPTAYFKAVLRYKKSSTIGYSDFMSAGFYFDHVKDRSAAFSKSYSMSVSALEKKLGYKLFVNLDKKVGDETAKKIKDQDPTTVTWWWQ
jgi:endonuclease G